MDDRRGERCDRRPCARGLGTHGRNDPVILPPSSDGTTGAPTRSPLCRGSAGARPTSRARRRTGKRRATPPGSAPYGRLTAQPNLQPTAHAQQPPAPAGGATNPPSRRSLRPPHQPTTTRRSAHATRRTPERRQEAARKHIQSRASEPRTRACNPCRVPWVPMYCIKARAPRSREASPGALGRPVRAGARTCLRPPCRPRRPEREGRPAHPDSTRKALQLSA